MARTSRKMDALILLALLAAPAVHAQLSNLPNLSTATRSQTSSVSSTLSQSSSTASSSATTDASTTATQTATSASSFIGLTGVPTIAGAGIPSMVIPYTANAPFMRKSNMPEGTVFIIVGAILGFLGACVLAWRCLIAWSINRSVKRAAIASIRGSEKTSTWGGSGPGSNNGYYPSKGGYYSEYAAGSSMSLDALSSAGRQLRKSHNRDNESQVRHSSALPPAGLFFSPTAQAAGRNSIATENRGSAFLPAGYYVSPSAAQPASGAGSTTVGGSLAPYARQSMAAPSPPGTSNGPSSRGNTGYAKDSARDGLRPHEGLRAVSGDSSHAGASRPGSFAVNGMYNHPSSSSLMVGVGPQQGNEGLGGTRAPSAYLDDLFENHGNGPRERF